MSGYRALISLFTNYEYYHWVFQRFPRLVTPIVYRPPQEQPSTICISALSAANPLGARDERHDNLRLPMQPQMVGRC